MCTYTDCVYSEFGVLQNYLLTYLLTYLQYNTIILFKERIERT